MNTTRITLTLALFSACACASSPPPEPTSAATTPSAATATPADTATPPDATAAKKHLAEHVTYPATRAQVLAACADTPEFTGGEKRWLSEHLAEGNYASADQVATALGL